MPFDTTKADITIVLRDKLPWFKIEPGFMFRDEDNDICMVVGFGKYGLINHKRVALPNGESFHMSFHEDSPKTLVCVCHYKGGYLFFGIMDEPERLSSYRPM